MSSPLDSAAVRYGIALFNAILVAAIAFLFLSGTVRLVALGIAVLEVLVTPQIMKRAA